MSVSPTGPKHWVPLMFNSNHLLAQQTVAATLAEVGILSQDNKEGPSAAVNPPDAGAIPQDAKPMTTRYASDKGRVLLSATFQCARAGLPSDSSQTLEDAKKVGCEFELCGTISKSQPDVMVFVERHGHSGHDPGSLGDQKYLKLHPDIITEVQKLNAAGMPADKILLAWQATGVIKPLGPDGAIDGRTLASLDKIQNIVKAFRKNTHNHCNDFLGVENLYLPCF